MSAGAALPKISNPPAADEPAASASEKDGQNDSFVRDKLLAPFRRKSFVDRLILGEQERLTRNPMRVGFDKLVIHPSNRLKIFFDSLVQLATLYSLTAVPLQFAFGATPPFAFDFLVDLMFIFDVVLHFFHGYVDRGYPVLSLRLVSYRYLTSWFVIEAIASLPYDLLFKERTVYLIALLRAFRLRKLGVAIANTRIGNRSSGLVAFLRVLYILGAWVIFAHVFACIFFSLGWRLRCTSVSYQATWLDVLQYPELELPPCPPDGVVPFDEEYWSEKLKPVELLQGDTVGRPRWLEMWVLSLHWAISSMSSLGYGKGPQGITTMEFLFTIFCQITGACLYAAIFGNIAQLLARLDAPGARFRAQRDKIDEFVSFHELPNELTKKLHSYCKFLFAVNHGFDVGQISGALPPNLQHELLLHLHAPLVKSVPMFAECDDAFIKSIVLQLRPQVLLGGDAAFKAQEAGTEMYFIMRGEMRMMDETLTVCYNALYSGAYFGELAMLTGQPRTATALAVTDCVLFYINQADFNLVARKWPKALASILAKAKERLERINNCNSNTLARQLGERLSEVRQDIATEGGGILGLPTSSSKEKSRLSGSIARNFCSAAGAPKMPVGNERTTHHEPHAFNMTRPPSSVPSTFIAPNSPFHSATEPAPMPPGSSAAGEEDSWRSAMEAALYRTNQGVEHILARLEQQSDMIVAMQIGHMPNGMQQQQQSSDPFHGNIMAA